MLKRAIILFFSCWLASTLLAQSQTDPIFFLIKEKKRIDLLDHILDNKLTLQDSVRSTLATKVYFTTVDSIWSLLLKIRVTPTQRDSIVYYIQAVLGNVRSLDLKSLDKNNRQLSNIQQILYGIRRNDLLSVLKSNPLVSLEQTGLFSFRPEAEPFLIFAAKKYPIDVILYYSLYYNKPFVTRVIEEAVANAPDEAKRFLIEGNPINHIIQKSTSPSLVRMREILQKYGKKSSAYTLMDVIEKNNLSIEKADSIANLPTTFLKTLIQIRMQKSPMAEYSVERALENQSLRFVRVLNDLHNEGDNERFASINNFSAAQLYTLIVYSEEEIFTSTFNGILNRLIGKLGRENGYSFIQTVGFNRYRTFIKQLAAFGKLGLFLNTMTLDEQKKLMLLFASGLDDADSDIGEAVEVADAYTSISDQSLAASIRQTIKSEYRRAVLNESYSGATIYGLLGSLISSFKPLEDSWYQKIALKYTIPNITFIQNNALFVQNTQCVWHMYFYDDEDGIASFQSFTAIFKDPNWQITKEDSLHVRISSINGKPITIFANKPKAEYEGQAYLEHLLDSAGIQPDVLIHRGHSYYASKTIEKIKPSAKLFVLGSCGGYNSLSGVIQRAPEVQIVSSKQIGVQAVNNPMLKIIADETRKGNDIEWAVVWAKLDAQLKSNPAVYGRFKDYIPPHKNVSALFIRTYMKSTGTIQ